MTLTINRIIGALVDARGDLAQAAGRTRCVGALAGGRSHPARTDLVAKHRINTLRAMQRIDGVIASAIHQAWDQH